MRRDLSRLLRPASIAVVGGGVWAAQVVRQSLKMGFQGAIYRVHPRADPVEGIAAVPRLADLPEIPDAVFLGVNRHATLEAVRELSAMGAGGAVCFASGFSEALAEDRSGADLQSALVAAAGEMPILGPNCYGFVNALDGALLWPDQHGCERVERGVAILTQSSNIAINLSMQRRGLPIACLVTCGNMAQCTQAEIAMALLDDPRITAIGLHIEGFGDTQVWHALARKAAGKGVPLLALKVGTSEHARAAAVSHTASLAGSHAGAMALLARMGVRPLQDLPGFLSALMLAHVAGPLESDALSSISCSGGEASLVADMAAGFSVSLPALTAPQRQALSVALGPMVALSNPLDYHTYIWGDVEKMTAAWLPMAADHIGLVLVVLDYPHTDASAWDAATQAAIALRVRGGRPVAVVSTLPELLPLEISVQLLAEGVVPLHGLREALAAAEALAARQNIAVLPPLPPLPDVPFKVLSEAASKNLLTEFGVTVPRGTSAPAGADLAFAASELTAPLVLKSSGLAHKSESGGVRLGLAHADLEAAARPMPGDTFLIEERVTGGVAELLVGVRRDAAHGFVLTLAAGGVLSELVQDSVSLVLPVTEDEVTTALRRLRVSRLIEGYRGAPAGNIPVLMACIMSVQDCVMAHAAEICELEINPLILTPDRAVAVDALVAWAEDSEGERSGQ